MSTMANNDIMILILACSLRYSKPPKLWFLQPGLTVTQCYIYIIYICVCVHQFGKSRNLMKCVQEQNRRRMKTWDQTTGEELTAFWTRFNWIGSEYHEILPWEYHKNTPKLDGYTMLYPNWPSWFFFTIAAEAPWMNWSWVEPISLLAAIEATGNIDPCDPCWSMFGPFCTICLRLASEDWAGSNLGTAIG